jgi:hypothetical protein
MLTDEVLCLSREKAKEGKGGDNRRVPPISSKGKVTVSMSRRVVDVVRC